MIYMIAPVQPFSPSAAEMEEYAFYSQIKEQAPNPHLSWYQGQYVEADTPNGNGHMWTGDTLAIASMTPMFMPVTVMHDPRTAVGVIADLAFKTPEKDGVPRAKIETSLAIWSHRFPEAAMEAEVNAREGSLMQSMECLAMHYSCGSCGMTYHKLPHGAERANWCPHLKGENGETAVRILGNVCFTGTGLIFGTRGAKGADPGAYLADLEEEVAEFHEKWHHDSRHVSTSTPTRRTIKMDVKEVPVTEYDRLVAFEQKFNDEKARADAAESKVEETETELTAVKAERDTLKTDKEGLEEKARREDLSKKRIGELGPGFTGALGDFTKSRVETQAAELSDEDWESRLKELEETTGKKRDEGAPEGEEKTDDPESPEFTAQQVTAFKPDGKTPTPGTQADPTTRHATVGALARSFDPKPPAAA